MNINEFIKTVERNFGINLSEESIRKLEIYANYLLEYNKHTNLTAIKKLEEVYLKHFYDSLTLIKLVDFNDEKLLDIGSGAGFPGLVLAIIFPNLQVTLLDSNNKKTTFLKECIEKIQINNVLVETSRAEDFTRIHREEYDYVTSRAVAELRVLLELNIPSLKINGKFLVMKANLQNELINSKKTINVLKCKIDKKEEFELPNNAGYRTLLSIIKEEITDLKYPRTYDKIKKKEL